MTSKVVPHEPADSDGKRLSAEAGGSGGWRPISSAPKDGTIIDVWEDGARKANVFWHPPQDSWASYSWRRSKRGEVHRVTVSHVDLTPSHWMPPPGPPAKGASQ